eukprot:TRINITY_DN8604_c0_g1_i1.p1 TRINITY_DN8604_c0_g1~~TRINITY_DN8604_c0_g1_i1.p1  ORF type:complete len:712 (+),score=110.76 TRINITY_DN8604_c0_g1_i1:58-2193(+)
MDLHWSPVVSWSKLGVLETDMQKLGFHNLSSSSSRVAVSQRLQHTQCTVSRPSEKEGSHVGSLKVQATSSTGDFSVVRPIIRPIKALSKVPWSNTSVEPNPTPPKELLAQARKRKEFERLQKEAEAEFETPPGGAGSAPFPFWRKKKSPELRETQALTRRIVALGKRRQLEQVFDALGTAKKTGVAVNLITLNAVLAACVNCGEIDRAIEVFEAMVRPGGVGADTITYGTLLKGLGQAKRLDEAFQLLEDMESGRVPGKPKLSEVHLNTLINACAEAGEALRARGVLARYRNLGQGARPTTFTYNLLIKGYARSDNPLEALKVMEEMRLQGLPLQRMSYNSLILACVRGQDLDMALELLEDMKSEARRLNTSQLLPDVVTYTTLLKGVAEDGDLDAVRALAAEMKTVPTCAVDRVAYTAIIDACIASGSPQDGVRFMSEMEELAKSDPLLRPRAHVFLALMRAFAEVGDVSRTRQLAERMGTDASGHVWPEERSEADELVMEAAMHARQVEVASETLKKIWSAQNGKPSFTPRGTKALVQLMAASNFSLPAFQPIPLRPEVPLRAPVEDIMVQVATATVDQRVRHVAARFCHLDWLPVCEPSSKRCLGVVYPRDCTDLDLLLGDIMQPPPPSIHRSALVSQAIDLLLDRKAPLLVVTDRRTHSPSLLRMGISPPPSSLLEPEEPRVAHGFISLRQLCEGALLDGKAAPTSP